MGKKSTPKMPEMPDVEEMIRTSARVNRVNSTNPYGSQTFTENSDGTWNNNTEFSPELEALFARQKEMAGAAPTTYQSGGMGDALRARIDEKLGRSTPASYSAPSYSAVQMPEPTDDPEEVPTTGVPRGRPPQPPIRGGEVNWRRGYPNLRHRL